MARIADKHGLTNAYRPYGSKRVVKRGRPRKYLFGAPSRKRRTSSRSSYKRYTGYDASNIEVDTSGCATAALIPFFMILLIFFSLVPIFRCLIPVIIGASVLLVVEDKCKKAWGLPSGRWSKPVSIGWTILTAFAMFAGLVIVLLIQLANIPIISIFIFVIFYVWLSFLILRRKYRKIKMDSDDYTEVYDEEATFDAYRADDVSIVDGMEGHDFECFCANLLKRNGFVDVSVTPGSGDQGVDILATKDGIKYAIQCKNYASPLSNTPVQEVSAGKIFYNCHVGVVLTNSTFTPGAISLAKATGVLLWDRSMLSQLMRKD